VRARVPVVLAALGMATGGAGCGTGDESPSQSGEPDVPFAVVSPPPASTAPAPAVAPARAPGPPGSLAAYTRRTVILRARPGGAPEVRLKPRTEFDSPRVMGVVGRRGRWVAVLVPEVRGRPAWLDTRRGVELIRTRFAIDVDLSQRRLTLRRDGREVARTTVAIGRPATPTPPGRYAVTDKLVTRKPTDSPYGCCVLALSGHQPEILQNWGGGDRLAIHSTRAEQTIGQAASLGCLRAAMPVMRRLVRLVPLGTLVRVRS